MTKNGHQKFWGIEEFFVKSVSKISFYHFRILSENIHQLLTPFPKFWFCCSPKKFMTSLRLCRHEIGILGIFICWCG